MNKQCCRCNKVKDITEYPKDRRSPLGYSGRNCKVCVNIKNRQRNNKVSVLEKNCGTCEQVKPASEFQRDKKSFDGLQGNCKSCRNASKRRQWHENREHNLKVRKEYTEANRDRINSKKREYYYADRENILEKQKSYTERNKEARTKYRRKHYLENKHIYTENARKRERKLSEGINTQYTDRFKEIYYVGAAISSEYNIKYQVDHIIPLTNKKVSGLNVPWNIQILTEDENRSKKNKFDGTYDNESWRS